MSDEDDVRKLISEGGWQQTDTGSAIRLYLRLWPDDWVDSLMFGDDLHKAYGERINQDGDPVWQLVGTVAKIVAALRALPTPDAPDAPRTVLPSHDTTDRDM